MHNVARFAFCLAALLLVRTASLAGPTPIHAPFNVAFIGDSWFAGVGVATACYPRIRLSSAACPSGQSIPDKIVASLGANVTAYQTLALGGGYLFDAVNNELPLIDPAVTLVVVMIGLNDETPLEQTWGSTNAYTNSVYNPQGFSELASDMTPRYTEIVRSIYKSNPESNIYLVTPAINYLFPYGGAANIAQYQTAYASLLASLNTMSSAVSGVIGFGASSIYDASWYTSSGCATAGITSCVGHPNAVGAAGMAAVIAAGINL